eukprot:gene7565-61193_t
MPQRCLSVIGDPNEELRIDASDGCAYAFEDFEHHYGEGQAEVLEPDVDAEEGVGDVDLLPGQRPVALHGSGSGSGAGTPLAAAAAAAVAAADGVCVTHFLSTHFLSTHFLSTHFLSTHFLSTHFLSTHFLGSLGPAPQPEQRRIAG